MLFFLGFDTLTLTNNPAFHRTTPMHHIRKARNILTTIVVQNIVY